MTNNLQTLIEEQERACVEYRLAKEQSAGIQTDATPYIEGYKEDFNFLRKSMEMAWELNEPNEAKILDNFIDRLSRRIREIKAQSDDVYYRSGLSTTLLEAGKLLVEMYPQQLQSPEPEGEKERGE